MIVLKKILLLIFSFCLLPDAFCQSPGPAMNYWQQEVNYKIDVTLNDVEHTLDGYIKMDYHNNSPDTLHFIWMHVWPNAYKNDRTAFSDQLLENGRTDFYFSDNDKRGYINRLDFKMNGIIARMEDHPQHQDIIKIIPQQPVAPGSKATIETPFHIKLPLNFSRGGHVGQTYQVTQWYPKPAVYDRKGWHPMPYLDQGEFYSEFGTYEVQITLPKNYVVAATGDLQETEEKQWLGKLKYVPEEKEEKKDKSQKTRVPHTKKIASAEETKTLHYQQKDVHDFAWFANKSYSVDHDTLLLPSGRIIDVYSFYPPEQYSVWKNSISFIKKSINRRGQWLGEYPYNVVSVAEAHIGFYGGMEYPTITSVFPVKNEQVLEQAIEHEVGHNWHYGILASNERDHPWMDEGMNTFYDTRYRRMDGNISSKGKFKSKFWLKRIPSYPDTMILQTITRIKKDQPVETVSTEFTNLNYNLIAYAKSAQWMQLLERSLGKETFDSCMHEYYRRWQFKHPYPEDFKKLFEDISGRNLDSVFALLNKKGDINNYPGKDTRFASFFNLKDTYKHNYIFIAPSAGYNYYDKVMLGIAIHNYTLPFSKFQFFVTPLYATGSSQLNGLGRISYSWYPGSNGKKIELALAGASFTGDSFTDSIDNKKYLRFAKIVPSLKIIFSNKNPRSSIKKFLQWKSFFISEQNLRFTRDTINQADIISYPVKDRYLNQLRFVLQNSRVLYPYKGELQLEQGKDFIRAAFTGNYYFNYVKDGGMNVRLFAGKFFYLGDKTYLKQFETDIYHLNMSGPKGYEDYTYSNYFMGRNEFEKLPSQQIMIRDGAFKVRTDLLSSKIGKTDDWLAAANFTTDVPKNINPLQKLPVKIPLKAFVDIGTYAEAWKKNSSTGRFIYDAGLQLSVFKNIVNIYIPLFYSKVYSDYFKSTITEKRFIKNVSFSIDIQNLNVKKLFPLIPF